LPNEIRLSDQGTLWKGATLTPTPLVGNLSQLDLWLTRYQQDPRAFYFDYIENTLFNEGLAKARWEEQDLIDPTGLMWFPKADTLFVNLYLESHAVFYYQDQAWELEMQTEYPLSGSIRLRIDEIPTAPQAIALRIPGWAINRPLPDTTYEYRHYSNRSLTLRVNGDLFHPELTKGYALIYRKWQKGDRIDLDFPMAVRRVKRKTDGRLAFSYGPLVFVPQAEQTDSMWAVSPVEQYFFDQAGGGSLQGNLWQEEGTNKEIWVPFWKRNPAKSSVVWLLERQK